MREGPEVGGNPTPAESHGSRHATIELGLVALIALAVRLIDLGHPPFIDEMNHVLAAHSLLADGTLVIHEGEPYGRGALFTAIVAGFYAVFGHSLEVGRLPSVISGVLLVGMLFAWLRSSASRVAAWSGALLLCFAPVAIYLSQWVRFYMLHALLFWLGAWAVYRLVERLDTGRRAWLTGVGGVLALLLAFHLQITTVVGLGGIFLFVGLVEGPRLFDVIESRRRRYLVVGGMLVAFVVGLGTLEVLGVIDWLAARATLVDTWAIERALEPRFYHWLFLDQYGFLWALFPLAGLLALASRWRLALLFLSVFGVAVVAHSIAAWKAERYVFYAMPALFAVWGLAAGEAVPWFSRRLVEAGRARLGRFPAWASHVAVGGAVLVGLAFASTGLKSYTTTRLIFLQGREWSPPPGHTGEWYRGHPDWERVAPRLAALHDSVEVVIGEPDMSVVYYVGDVDFVLYAGNLVRRARRTGPHDMHPEFSVRVKIGRPLISAPESIELIRSCYASGMIVAEDHVWGWRAGVPQPTADYIEANVPRVSLPDGAGIRAYRWRTAEPEQSSRCEELRRKRREAPVTHRP